MRSLIVVMALVGVAEAQVKVVAEWKAGVVSRLIGVDGDGNAYVWHQEEKAFSIDTIDKSGKRTEWRATGNNVKHWLWANVYNDFEPIDGDYAKDLARYAAMIRATGPWGTRTGAPTPVMAAGGVVLFGFAKEYGNEHWYVATADGKPGRLLDSDSAPRISPDGKWMVEPRLLHHVCIEEPKSGTPRSCPEGLPEKTVPSTILWSADSRWLYERDVESRCLYRLDVNQANAKWEPVRCGRFAFLPSPDVKTAALLGSDAIEWIELPSGKTLRKGAGFAEMGLPIDELALTDEHGRIAALDENQHRLFILDLDGRFGAIETDGYFEGLRATRWQNGSFLVIRRTNATDQLIRVNAEAILKPR